MRLVFYAYLRAKAGDTSCPGISAMLLHPSLAACTGLHSCLHSCGMAAGTQSSCTAAVLVVLPRAADALHAGATSTANKKHGSLQLLSA